MAKALLGYRTATDQRLVLETVELRRIRDLEGLVARLQKDNDRLRADLRQAEAVAGGAYDCRVTSPATDTPAELLRLRASIDNIDAALVHLLAERFKCTQQAVSSRPAAVCRRPTPRARRTRSSGCARSRTPPGSTRSSRRSSSRSSSRRSSATTRHWPPAARQS